nr:penicillin-binding transpeptidase domain-containing protein [Nocardioides perillae]
MAACTGGGGGDEADRAAARAAAEQAVRGLAARDLAEVPLADGADPATATAALVEVVDGMGDLEPAVTLDEVEHLAGGQGGESGGSGEGSEGAPRATATLRWSWPLPSGAWTYTSRLALTGTGTGDWAAAWSPDVVEPSLRPGEELELVELAPARGDVLGRGGAALVTERPVVRVGVDKTQVGRAGLDRAARTVAQAVDVDPAAYVEQVRAAGPRAFVEAIVLRQEDTTPRLVRRLRATPGAVTIGTTRPLAPSRDFAAALLGRVGEATAEVVEESGGRVQPGDLVGLSGLAGRYDEQLAGTPGVQVRAVVVGDDGATGEPRVLHEADPVDGEPLRTTLDLELQTRAEQLLADVGPPSALVALRPSSGEVLVLADGPGSAGLPTASFGQYAPGSTAKVVTALALLRAGLGPDDTVTCAPQEVVDGRAFSNYDDYPAADLGRITLRRAIASSCNTALIAERRRVEPSRLTEAAAALGLGVDHDLGFPAYFGQVPPPASRTGAAAALIGQGQVLASPLAMAAVVASVQAGRAVLPQLLPDQRVDQVAPTTPLTEREAAQLRDLLRAVVTSGSGSALADAPGPPVLAKTGTAEHGEPDAAGELATHAWMVAAQGDLAVAAFVEDGASGSRTAGPLLEALLRAARDLR